jgi:hypothetical protein
MMMMMMIKGTKRMSGHLIPTHQVSYCVSITKTYRLMLFRGIIAVYSKGHTKHVHTLEKAEYSYKVVKDKARGI